MNKEHYDILMKGVKVWNEWRMKSRISPDLIFADLSNARLHSVDFRFANLIDANLSSADLSYANLISADLRSTIFWSANLHNADLRCANLSSADLSYAKLESAKLRYTDLRLADLRHANLRYTDFRSADLRGTNLSNADLRYADLRYANLNGANLHNANFRDARLHSANFRYALLIFTDFRGAKLRYINFCGADLTHANFNSADLHKANFDDVSLGYTILNSLDLATCKNLDKIKHEGPSYVDQHTLNLSKGKLPKIFLKGIGFSSWQIVSAKLNDPALNSNQILDLVYEIDHLRNKSPLQIHNLFISYSHTDKHFINFLEKYLINRDISFWRDTHNATAGPLESIVVRAMERNPTVLLVLSKNSVNSDWVEFEVKKARKLEKELKRHVLCPIALDDAWKDCDWENVIMDQVKKYKILDFSNWRDESFFEGQFKKLIKGLDLFYKGSP